MGAELGNINVAVVNEDGSPLEHAAVTLLGVGAPQFRATDANGKCTFGALPAGNYRLMVALEGFNTGSRLVQVSGSGDSTVTVELRVVSAESRRPKGISRVLSFAPVLFLAGLATIFAVLLYKGFTNVNIDLTDVNAARGMITFVVAVVTVAIALILVTAAFLSGGREIDKRFAFGKEVFTILIGVLGTVMGFYYGQASGAAQSTNGSTQQSAQVISITVPELKPAPKSNSEFTLTANITGGTRPYTYSVVFDKPETISTPATNVVSEDGVIVRKFTVAPNPEFKDQEVRYRIEVVDQKQATGVFDKGSFKIAP